jgi:hypothetical protein
VLEWLVPTIRSAADVLLSWDIAIVASRNLSSKESRKVSIVRVAVKRVEALPSSGSELPRCNPCFLYWFKIVS